ncbi:MAG: class I SAM-dependent methyltransferase [Candidatus Marinimicrobia bacterium]|jgi:cyclopropane fatty-acyl-phospholipid synthase-like methyltransferase|nr:class I SAM-dependent methyltransferase [Candidatus Neomarinimicrobiota bacterium]MBT3501866.1 class I SAM-dependent methyltransferase [Candidatus Neomarinimicrobiota bacterium]MBT3838608.1 class I SAM-dependent methyltransferase [Candidatus Neomarinimicrobiota bacterium]MBT3999778.1 class I SAM-dependent methyltransferase [Candidatus Neomarinimicrobiota bacterium]MBT4578647.1 class I SAM-dependent methyltransferase [Candidatus Neomarinimicrobiota bacterium]
MKTLTERANKLENDGIFLGGPVKFFETAGRKQLITLLSKGLTPTSKVLDIGCGCLRGGYWLIHFLDKGCYFGIEPNTEMLDAGLKTLLEPELLNLKTPRFNPNSTFDFSIFEEKFDFIVARSIWTHASKEQIQTMLDEFVISVNPNGMFITSYIKPTLFKREYNNSKWIGISHESNQPGIARHSLSWIWSECRKRSLNVSEIKGHEYNFGNQMWIKIQRD